MAGWFRRGHARVRRIYRVLFPPKLKDLTARDLFEENKAKAAIARHIYAGGIGIVPAAGTLVLVINVLYRVKGDVNLSLAILLSLPLSSLAIIMLVSLINLFLIGTGNALATLYGQKGLSPQFRHWIGVGLWVVISSSAFALSWSFFLVLLISVYVYWRSERAEHAAASVPIAQWLSSDVPPTDTVLRRLWLEGRWNLKRKGLLDSGAVPRVLPRPFLYRSEIDVEQDVVKRLNLIKSAQPRTSFGRIASVFGVSLGIYAAQLFTTPLAFAPMVLLNYSGDSRVGYLIGSTERPLFIDREVQSGEYLDPARIESERVCSPTNFSKSIFRVWQSEKKHVDC